MTDDGPDRAEDKVGNLRGVLPAGTTLRGYELKSILGQGAFGITYRARDLTLSRDVAIKEYLPTTLALREGRTTVLPRSPDHAEQFAWGRERFLEEARTLARLDRTPAIVRVHDYLEANGTAYMVMGLVEGETLAKRLMREQRLTPEAVERLLFPLLDGLEEVHATGFLHRDIKPANIMVDSHGRPTLIDFGAARAAMAGRSTTMTAIFTPGYAAAEQYTSAELGPWTDIYGLSATLYHAITGKIPPSAIERILKDIYQPLSELNPEGHPPELLAGIDAGMARHVDDRPQGIAEWRHVLRTGEHQPAAREATQVEHRPRRSRRKTGIALRGPALWASAAAAAILLAGGGYLAFTASGPATVGTAALSLSAEQLEQALAERRKADTFAAEKRRLEDEARQKAEVDAEAKRQAESELEQARQARQKAEQELADLKARIAAGHAQPAQQDQAAMAAQRAAEEAAQRKAEADAAALRQAEEDAQKKLEADTEAKRQADEALARLEAERRKAEQEARQKAEAEQVALRQSSEEAQRKAAEAESVRKAEAERTKAEADRQKAEAERQKAEAEAKVRAEAETAEKALRLDQPGRERVQLALTSLGFDTRGTDGIFGPRSREMISAWQKARNQPATGFLTAAQQEALLKEAAVGLSKYDEQKKAEEDAKARAPSPPVPASPVAAVGASSSAASPDGPWRGTYACGPGAATSGWAFTLGLEMVINNRSGSISVKPSDSNGQTMDLQVSVRPPGVTVTRTVVAGSARESTLSGTFDGNSIHASGIESGAARRTCTIALTRGSPSGVPPSAQSNVAAAAPTAAQSPTIGAAQPSGTAYDGTYRGDVDLVGLMNNRHRVVASLRVTNTQGVVSLTTRGCSPSQFSVTVSPTGIVTGEGYLNCIVAGGATGALKIDGKFEGKSLSLAFRAARDEFRISLTPGGEASPALPSPDGLWRGTYKCGAGLAASSISYTEEINLALDMRLTGGAGTWKSNNPSPSNGFTLEIRISIDGTAVSFSRFYPGGAGAGMSSMSTPAMLSGRYDGNTIGATGREATTGSRQCTLALTRV